MKRITNLRENLLRELDTEYAQIRTQLTEGYGPAQFNQNGQRKQSVLLSGFRVKTEEIQDLNRLLSQLKVKRS